MSNNCLVTRLNSNVDNDLLLKINEILLDVVPVDTPSDNTSLLVLIRGAQNYRTEVFNLTIIGDGYFSDTLGGSGIGKTTQLSKDHPSVYVSNGTYKIKIDNKYKIGYIRGAGQRFDSADLKYSSISYIVADGYYDGNIQGTWENMEYVDIINPIEPCDISVFSNFSKSFFTYLRLTGNNFYGDITSFNPCYNLSTFKVLRGTNITGNLEDVINAWRTKRSSGTVTAETYNTKVKIYGNDLTTGESISWTATTITCNGHTYDNEGNIVS